MDHLIWLALLLVLKPVIFLLGYFLLDVVPRKIKHLWQGPPCRTPRLIHPFAGGQESIDYAALMERLEFVETDTENRNSVYVDRETGQAWIGEYFEEGCLSG
jgi:hypothetical protein